MVVFAQLTDRRFPCKLFGRSYETFRSRFGTMVGRWHVTHIYFWGESVDLRHIDRQFLPCPYFIYK